MIFVTAFTLFWILKVSNLTTAQHVLIRIYDICTQDTSFSMLLKLSFVSVAFCHFDLVQTLPFFCVLIKAPM